MIDMAVGSRIQKWIQKCVCKWDGETAMRNAAHLVDRHTSHAGAHSFFGRFSLPVSPINNESVASSSSRWKQPQASPRLASSHLTLPRLASLLTFHIQFCSKISDTDCFLMAPPGAAHLHCAHLQRCWRWLIPHHMERVKHLWLNHSDRVLPHHLIQVKSRFERYGYGDKVIHWLLVLIHSERH